MASVFLFSFASAYSWRIPIVFHVFLLPHSSKKTVLSSSIYCPNCPHLFDHFYPRTSSIFPSAVHCLDISLGFPGFLRFFTSLFTCCGPILYSTKISPVLVLWSQHAQVEKKSSGSCFPDQFHRCKSARLGHARCQPAPYGEDLVPGLGSETETHFLSGFFSISFQCLGIWRFPPVSFFHLFPT